MYVLSEYIFVDTHFTINKNNTELYINVCYL